MTEKVNENNEVSASPDSYVVIRIKLPTVKTLVGKVGSMFNNVLAKKNSMDETESESESVDDTASDEIELAEGTKKIIVNTNGEQNLNDGVRVRDRGMAEKVKLIVKKRLLEPPRTAEARRISKEIEKELKKKVKKVKDVGSDEKRIELCKKKIIMGMRCRPLSDSGKLQYDKNGFLIPENLP